MDSFINQKEIAEGRERGSEGGRERRRGGFVAAVSREDCLRKVSAASAEPSLQAGSQPLRPIDPLGGRDRGGADATAETQTSQVLLPCTWRDC